MIRLARNDAQLESNDLLLITIVRPVAFLGRGRVESRRAMIPACTFIRFQPLLYNYIND